MNDTLIYFGGELKALDENGAIGGQLVRFTKKGDGDLTKEWFTAKTYLGKDDGDGVDVLFHHGMPVGKGLEGFAEHIFSNPVKTSRNDIGVWAETVLNLADKYEAKVFELVKAGKLGWSSGSTARVVRKSADGEILRWPIVEASLTHAPCEPRNSAIAIKSAEDFSSLFIPSKASGGDVFEQNLREENATFWRLEHALIETSKDIANASVSSEITEADIDVISLVTDAFARFSQHGIPMVVNQITAWRKQPDRENFYIKSLLQSYFAEGLREGLRFPDRLDLALDVIEKVANDATEINEIRKAQKAGAKISKARLDKLKQMINGLSSLVAEVEKDPMAEVTDMGKFADAATVNGLVAQFEHIKMRQTLAS